MVKGSALKALRSILGTTKGKGRTGHSYKKKEASDTDQKKGSSTADKKATSQTSMKKGNN